MFFAFIYLYSTYFQIHNIVTWHQIIKSEFTFDYFHDNFHILKKTWNAKTLTQICLWFRVLFRHPAVVIVIRRGEGMLSPRHLPSLSLNITKRGCSAGIEFTKMSQNIRIKIQLSYVYVLFHTFHKPKICWHFQKLEVISKILKQ